MCINLFSLSCAWIHIGPPFIRQIPPIKAVAGRSLHVQCPVSGFPIENISWEKGTCYKSKLLFQAIYVWYVFIRINIMLCVWWLMITFPVHTPHLFRWLVIIRILYTKRAVARPNMCNVELKNRNSERFGNLQTRLISLLTDLSIYDIHLHASVTRELGSFIWTFSYENVDLSYIVLFQ